MAGKISPSMMCVPFHELEAAVRAFERAGIEYLHMDVMDGRFVPNLMLGTDFIKQLREFTNIPLDIHLMVERPEERLGWFGISEGEYVSFHCEATRFPQRVCAEIRALGAKPMPALNPATPLCALEDILPDADGVLLMGVNPGFAGQRLIPQVIDKIRRLREMLDGGGFSHLEIEVDGNTSEENAFLMRGAGADIFVGGTAGLFMKGYNLEERIQNYKKIIK